MNASTRKRRAPHGAATLVLALPLLACVRHVPAPTPPAVAGCAHDNDCKLERICEENRCVWPPERKTEVIADNTPPPESTPESAPEPPPSSAGTATTMFRLDALHRGRSPHRLPEKAPSIAWQFTTKGPISGSVAVLADGSVAAGSHDGALHILDPIGKPRWSLVTGDLIFGTPAVAAGNQLYIGSGDDHLYAVDLAGMQLAWKIKLGDCAQSRGVGPEQSRCDADGGPTLAPDGTVYVGSHGLFAISPDGQIKWRFETATRVPVAPALLGDGTIVFGAQDDTLYALNPDGTKKWDFRTGGDIESSPAITDDGSIVFGCDDDKIYALSTEGELLWAFSAGGDVRASPAVGRDGNILVGAFDSMFYAISPDGVLQWTFHAGDRIASSALVDADGAILFGAQDDRLYTLESDGHLRWSVELGGDIDSSPVLGPDGVIYVGSDDHNLYALRSID